MMRDKRKTNELADIQSQHISEWQIEGRKEARNRSETDLSIYFIKANSKRNRVRKKISLWFQFTTKLAFLYSHS